tara:strand:- start:1874 stop:2032 length:159 start_codon:yes stop_codon:yes gene_type:complete
VIFAKSIKRVLISGGYGFIGGALTKRMLKEMNLQVFNIVKLGFASNKENYFQ